LSSSSCIKNDLWKSQGNVRHLFRFQIYLVHFHIAWLFLEEIKQNYLYSRLSSRRKVGC